MLGCLLGLSFRPTGINPDAVTQAIDVVRVISTTALAVVIVLGPGIAIRATWKRNLSLGFLPLPGLALLVLTGTLTWGLGVLGFVHPRISSALVVTPLMLSLPLIIGRSKEETLLSSEEWGVVILIGAGLGIAVGRTLWSLGPPGELYGGTIYRTLEVSDRPDSRISYHVVELIANGNSPFGSVAQSYFFPYSFSSRGPIPGIASAPIVLVSGGRPPAVIGSAPWTPFDAQGFMAYRLTMMTFASTAFLSLWALTVRLAGLRAARFAVLLAVTTPFLVHEIWFTWPKMFAASLVLLAALSLLDGRRVVAGLLVGIGYLVHPLALLSIPALVLLALWPIWRPRLRRPQVVRAITMLAAIASFLVAWRVLNGSHYTQSGFAGSLTQAGSTSTLLGRHVTMGSWLADRLVSLGNTLVPLRLFLLSAHDQEVNAVQACFPFCNGGSPGIVHFFYQYWDTVPFGLGIAFFPFLLVSLWKAILRWPWGVFVAVVVPFITFWIYWGGASTGLLREGLHTWVLTLIVVVAVQQASCGFSWLRSPVITGVLCSRAIEVLLVAMLPTLITTHRLLDSRFWLSDSAAVIMMIVLVLCLVGVVWREHAEHAPGPAVRVS